MSKIIKKTPQEVLKNLTDLINRYKPKGLTVTMVKNMVENENGDPKNSVNKYVMETIKYFQNKKLVDINKAVGIFNDFWNYWPHKSLGGKSPSELMSEEIKKQKKSKQKTEETKIRVGDSEMSLEEYDFMIKMMEERQKTV